MIGVQPLIYHGEYCIQQCRELVVPNQKIAHKIRSRRLKRFYRDVKGIYNDSIAVFSDKPAADMELLRKHLRHYSIAYASLQLRTGAITSFAFPVIMIIGFGVIGLGVLGISNDINYPVTNQDGSTVNFTLIAAGAGAITGAIIAAKLSIVIIRHTTVGINLGVLLVTGLAFAGIAIVMLQQNSTSYWPLVPHVNHGDVRDLLAAVILGVAEGIAGIGIFFIGGAVVIWTIVIEPIRARHPDTVIISMLVGLIHDLGSRPLRFGDVRFKADVCHTLQNASSYLQNAIPRVMKISDDAMNRTLKEQLNSSATHLRQMQLWVVFANEKTADDLRDGITYYINAVALGQYDLLPTATSAVPRSNRIHTIASFSRAILVALIPIGCIIGARYAGLSLSTQFTGWAIVVAITWAAITLISALDPLYKARLTDVRDFISVFRGKDN